MSDPEPPRLVRSQTVEFRPFPDRSFRITGSGADAAVLGEIERSGGLYQRDMAAFLRRVLPADGVAVDGGAHVGVLTCLLAGLAPAGRVFAFEPAPETRGYLQANLDANGLTNVTVEAAALGERDGRLSFSFNPQSPGGSAVAATGDLEVQSVRLDTWVRQHPLDRLDLVKFDLEGMELAALAGARGVIADFRPLLVVECNPVTLRRFGGRSFRDLLVVLRRRYPVVAVLGPGGKPVEVMGAGHLEEALARHGVVDLVALPSARSRVLTLGRGLAARARHNRDANRPPELNFVVEPNVGLTPALTEVAGPAESALTIPLQVANHGRQWLSSAFPHHPVHATYRILAADGSVQHGEGERTRLPEPIGPGGSVRVDVRVALPAEPGTYLIRLTLVQERFAWFDDVDPTAAVTVEATVTPSADEGDPGTAATIAAVPEDPDIEALVGELRARVAKRRADGEYPPGLEEDLGAQFAQFLARRVLVPRPVDLRGPLARLAAALPLDRLRIPLQSEIPAGAVLHRAVGKAVTRQTHGVIQQAQAALGPIAEALEALTTAVEDLAKEVREDLGPRLDAVLERQAAHERAILAWEQGRHPPASGP